MSRVKTVQERILAVAKQHGEHAAVKMRNQLYPADRYDGNELLQTVKNARTHYGNGKLSEVFPAMTMEMLIEMASCMAAVYGYMEAHDKKLALTNQVTAEFENRASEHIGGMTTEAQIIMYTAVVESAELPDYSKKEAAKKLAALLDQKRLCEEDDKTSLLIAQLEELLAEFHN